MRLLLAFSFISVTMLHYPKTRLHLISFISIASHSFAIGIEKAYEHDLKCHWFFTLNKHSEFYFTTVLFHISGNPSSIPLS